MTVTNMIYRSLKKSGLHNWGFFRIRQSDFAFNDLDLYAVDLTEDPDASQLDTEESRD